MSTKSTQSLRFAALVRVSTEKQEQQGESLRSQKKQNERDVERLGGTIVRAYGGQEHATPSWEKKEVDRLLQDAGKGLFDAVIVSYADRWSRDNAKSKEGLEAFRKAGIRFFVGSMEMDLFDPQHRFILGMNAEVGEFIALQQAKKSVENKIDRARRGLPACGALPFGRTYDKKTETWGVDEEKRAILLDIARRYLAGEPLLALTKEYGLNHSNICEVLRDRAGTVWVQRFRSESLNIDEEVPTEVPRLLDEETIRRVRHRLEARRTFQHGAPKNHYLLGGYVFCAECGRNLIGQPCNGRDPRLYYRHSHCGTSKECPIRPAPWVPAEKLEREVFRQLFTMFGNPSAIERAVKSAVPDSDDALNRKARLDEELGEVRRGRDRLVSLIAKGLLSEEDAAKQLGHPKDRERVLREELDAVAATLADVPDPARLRSYVERVEGAAGACIFVYDDAGDNHPGGNDLGTLLDMTEEEKRNLVRAVFDNERVDGKPAGVYVRREGAATPHRPKKYTFTIRGRIDFELVLSYATLPR